MKHPCYYIICKYSTHVILSFCVSACRVLSPGIVRELTHVEHLRSYNGHVLFPSLGRVRPSQPGRHQPAPPELLPQEWLSNKSNINDKSYFPQNIWKIHFLRDNDVTVLLLQCWVLIKFIQMNIFRNQIFWF